MFYVKSTKRFAYCLSFKFHFNLLHMKKINESFVCMWCERGVTPAPQTCRNHCPYCFISQHVDDVLPGDRASSCGAVMIPKDYMIANGQTKIRFVCTSCWHIHHNKACVDDEIWDLDAYIQKWREKYENEIREMEEG